MFMLLAFAHATPTWGPDDLVRVDDPEYPGAVCRSSTGALVPGIPDDVAWRPESLPEPDRVLVADQEAWPAALVLDAMGVQGWHDEGIRGAGVKVAVFDSGWFPGFIDPGEVGAVSTHDCFASSTCELAMDPARPAYALESGQHGWACAEVVRDVAPEAEIYLVRVNSFTAFENAVDWAIRNDIDVISLSLSYYNQSFTDGGGPYGGLLLRLEQAGALLVTSAGNTAEEHWWSDWQDGNDDGVLDANGEAGLLWVAPAGESSVNINWNQFENCGSTDLSARVVDERGWVYAEVDRNQVLDDEDCVPSERLKLTLPEATVLRIEVLHEAGPVMGLSVDVLVRGGSLVQPEPTRSLTDPGAHPLAFTVGAVKASDYWDGSVASYSSWGPNHAGQPAIDIAGPDGVSTDAFGPIGFFGTSASTPAVAGLLAVVMSEAPGRSSREAADLLQGWAMRGSSTSDPDPRWGSGKAHLPRRDPGVVGCGHRPLLLPFFLPLLPWWRRVRREASQIE